MPREFVPAAHYLTCRLLKDVRPEDGKFLPRVTDAERQPAAPPIATAGTRVWAFRDNETWVLLKRTGRALLLPEDRLKEFVESIRDPRTNKRLVDTGPEPREKHRVLWEVVHGGEM